ncbi:dehalogenase [Dehalogenimonas etheniformans]|uniref:Dehalogenase n=1 Tax=Dehalogenimonas etheniformans TaxID=1536648 RepID=A0A2P5P8R1_9CHLR|nr:dehalogenase [Dehalogenimonas etheniformans]
MQYFVLFVFLGALVGIGFSLLIKFIGSRNLKVKWYEWLIGTLGLALLLISIQAFLGARAEDFKFAALMSLLILAVPAIVLLLVAWQLVVRHKDPVNNPRKL